MGAARRCPALQAPGNRPGHRRRRRAGDLRRRPALGPELRSPGLRAVARGQGRRALRLVVLVGRFPRPEVSEKLCGGGASEPDASQDMRDVLTRRVLPAEAMNEERLARWFGTPTPA